MGRERMSTKEAALRGLAERVAGEMEAFNESGNQPGKRAGE